MLQKQPRLICIDIRAVPECRRLKPLCVSKKGLPVESTSLGIHMNPVVHEVVDRLQM